MRTVRQATRATVVLALLVASVRLASAAIPQGAPVAVKGRVTDSAGAPIGGLKVAFIATRVGLSIQRWRDRRLPQDAVATATDVNGEFSLAWPWNSFYDRFELVVALPLRESGRATERELARLDVGSRLDASRQAVAIFTLEDTRFLRQIQQFEAGLKTEDERRIYAELGRPEEILRVPYPDRLETAWWYFELGRVVRFRDGRLTETQEFDPVRPF
jgi:hypothetical protein